MSHVSECPTCGGAALLTAKMSGPLYTALPDRIPAATYRARAEAAEADAKAIGDRAWNHAITRVITELHNMKIEDAQRLADRIRALRTTEVRPK